MRRGVWGSPAKRRRRKWKYEACARSGESLKFYSAEMATMAGAYAAMATAGTVAPPAAPFIAAAAVGLAFISGVFGFFSGRSSKGPND